MAKRRGFKKNTRRDKYGRYRGSGAIKPWKNNNPDYFKKGQKIAARRQGKFVGTPKSTAKGMSTKKKVAIAVGVVAVAGATAYGVHRYRQSRANLPTGPRVGAVPIRPARRPIASGGRSLRTPMQARPGGARSVAGRSTPNVANSQRVTSARVAPSVPTPVAQPQALNTPAKVNAKSILTTTSALAAAAVLSGRGENEEHDADYERSVARWTAIEEAKKAGIPAAATFVDGGGRVQAPPTPKRTPFVAPRPSSFVGRPTAVSLKTPWDYGAREKGDAFRKSFPSSQLSAKPKANSAPAPTAAVKPSAPKVQPKTVTTQPTKPVNPPKTVRAATAPKKPIQVPKTTTGTKVAPDAAKPKRGRRTTTSPDVLTPEQTAAIASRAAALQGARRNQSVMGNEPQIPIRPSATPMGISKRVSAKPITSGGGVVQPQGKVMSSDDYHRMAAKYSKESTEEAFYNRLAELEDAGHRLPREARQFMSRFLG